MPRKIDPIRSDVGAARELFLSIVDQLNAELDYPTPTGNGAAKMLYAPTSVFMHPMNWDAKRRRRRLTSEQCVARYSDLMDRGMLRIVERRDHYRHLILVVEKCRENACNATRCATRSGL